MLHGFLDKTHMQDLGCNARTFETLKYLLTVIQRGRKAMDRDVRVLNKLRLGPGLGRDIVATLNMAIDYYEVSFLSCFFSLFIR